MGVSTRNGNLLKKFKLPFNAKLEKCIFTKQQKN